MGRTRRFLGGLSFGVLNQILVMGVGLWLTPFLLTRLGQHQYGLWLVATQILSYLMLLDLGVVALLPRETAYAVGRAGDAKRAEDLPSILGNTFTLVLGQLPWIALAAWVAWRHFIPEEWGELRAPLGAVVVAFVALFPFRILLATLQGLQDLAFLGAVQTCSWLGSTALTVGMILGGAGLKAMAAGWIASQTLTFLLCGLRLWRRFPGVLPRRRPRPSWSFARSWLARGVWVSVSQVAQILLNGTDLLIIGKLFGPLAVVPYACTGKLISVLSNQPALILANAQPALSELRAGAHQGRMLEIITTLTSATLLASGGIAVVVLAVNPGFVEWWVGAQQFAGMPLTALMVASMLLRHWNLTAIYSIFCFGYERRISMTVLADGILTAVSVWAGVKLLGPLGAPLGAMLGTCLISLPFNLSALAREAGATRAQLAVGLWPWFWRFLLVAGGAAAVSQVGARGFWEVGLSGALVGLAYVAALWQVAFRPPLVNYLRPRLSYLAQRLSRNWQVAPK